MKKETGNIFKALMGWVWCALLICSCKEINLYERQNSIKGGAWKREDKLNFTLDIRDTTTAYYLSAAIRHTAMYPYRNIWVRLGFRQPRSDSTVYSDFELPLADNDQWLGVGMNDVYYRKVRLFGQPIKFTRSGMALFTLQQIMREDPLPGLLQAGISIQPVGGSFN